MRSSEVLEIACKWEYTCNFASSVETLGFFRVSHTTYKNIDLWLTLMWVDVLTKMLYWVKLRD